MLREAHSWATGTPLMADWLGDSPIALPSVVSFFFFFVAVVGQAFLALHDTLGRFSPTFFPSLLH